MPKDVAELLRRFWTWLTDGGARKVKTALRALGIDDEVESFIARLALDAEKQWQMPDFADVLLRREVNTNRREWVVQMLIDKGVPSILARPAVELVVQLLKAQGILPKSTTAGGQ